MYQHLHIHNARNPLIAHHVGAFFRSMMWWMRVPHDAELHVRFVGMGEMQRVHHTQKGKPWPTDILTVAGSGSGSVAEGIMNTLLHAQDDDEHSAPNAMVAHCASKMRDELVDLGDIIVAPEYIFKRCKRFPSANLRTFEYMQAAYVHAFLHALGFDHCTSEQYEVMVKLEKWLARRVRRDMSRGIVSIGALA